MEKKSAIVYTNIQYLLPWIKKILSNRCLCSIKPSSSVDCNELDCDEYITTAFEIKGEETKEGEMSIYQKLSTMFVMMNNFYDDE